MLTFGAMAASCRALLPTIDTRADDRALSHLPLAQVADRNGFLTPSMKIRRAAIESAYEPHLDDWYAAGRAVVWQSAS